MAFLLGISITFNIISIIAFIIIYKYSLKGLTNKIENIALQNLGGFDISQVNFDDFKKGNY